MAQAGPARGPRDDRHQSLRRTGARGHRRPLVACTGGANTNVSVAKVNVKEGNVGATPMTFKVTLSNAWTTPVTVRLVLSKPTNAGLAQATGVGTIVNDD